jgi:hypothetical protein
MESLYSSAGSRGHVSPQLTQVTVKRLRFLGVGLYGLEMQPRQMKGAFGRRLTLVIPYREVQQIGD